MQLSRPRFNWSDALPPLLLAAGETAVAALWLPLIAGMIGGDVSAPSAAGLFIIGLCGYGWTRATSLRRSIPLTIAIALLLVVVWLLVSTGAHDLLRGWLTVVAGLVAWIRGSLLAGKSDLATPERAHRLLGYGALLSGTALFVSFAWNSAAGDAVQRAAWWTIPTLLLSALLLAALGVSGAVNPRDAHAATRHEASAGGFVVGLLLVAIVLIALFGGGTDLPQRAIFFALTSIFSIVYWLLSGILFAFTSVIEAILGLFNIHIDLLSQQQQQPPPTPEQQAAHQGMPLWAELLLIALVAVVVFVLLRWYLPRLRRLLQRRRSRSGVEVVRSSLHEPGAFFGNLRALWPRRRPGDTPLTVDPRTPPFDVRDAYRKLLVMATRSGQPRAPSESPRDYAVRLAGIWSNLDAPIANLTNRYIATRYGETSDPEALSEVHAAWEQIRDALLAEDGAEKEGL